MQIREICILDRNSPIFIGPQSLPVSRLVRHSVRSAKTVRGQVHHANPTVFTSLLLSNLLNVGNQQFNLQECWALDSQLDLG